MPEVKMKLTDQDAQRAENLTARHAFASKAHAVAEALSLTDFVSEEVNNNGATLFLQYPDGSKQKIIKPELGLK